jgi:hypothetical protein
MTKIKLLKSNINRSVASSSSSASDDYESLDVDYN